MPLTFTVIFVILNIIMGLFLVYSAVTSIPGFFPIKPISPAPKKHRFAAVICARNEEMVLPFLIDSLKNQNYPSELIQIIIVADNCTDNTALVARNRGVTVIERNNLEKIGKGHALCEVFSGLHPMLSELDGVCIFDADNVVHPDFFTHMNRAYAKGACAAQGYRQMKNPADSWITVANSSLFWIYNRFFNRARHIMGLSAQINGTGFMISAENILKNGWNTETITEDIELTIQTVLSGEKVYWVADALVYDEQPLLFRESYTQRKRWTQGIFQCIARYAPRLIKGFITTGNIQNLDTLIYLAAAPLATASFILGAIGFIYGLFHFPYLSLLGLAANYSAIVVAALIAARLEYGRKHKEMILPTLLYPFALMLWAALVIVVPFQSKAAIWKPIRHVQAVGIEDIIEDIHFKKEKNPKDSRII